MGKRKVTLVPTNKRVYRGVKYLTEALRTLRGITLPDDLTVTIISPEKIEVEFTPASDYMYHVNLHEISLTAKSYCWQNIRERS